MRTPSDTMIVSRMIYTDRSTISECYIDNEFECFILEPTCRLQPGVKLAIPTGKFELVMYESPKLKAKVEAMKAKGIALDPVLEAARVPLLLKVPNHDFVEMHPGNKPEDTEDCLLPGKTHDTDWVGNSVSAWIALVQKIEVKLAAGPYFIGIYGGEPKVKGEAPNA